MKKIIGITGGVGAGKSTVLKLLAEKYDADIFLADECAHDLMEPETEGLRQIVSRLGKDFLDDEGAIDRKKFADRIFHDPDTLKIVNGIIHPLVWRTLQDAAMRSEKKLVVIEAAIFETAPQGLFDEIWYIHADDEVRIQRLMESRGYTREKCLSIIAKQDTPEQFRNRSSRVIENGGTKEETERQLEEILDDEIC